MNSEAQSYRDALAAMEDKLIVRRYSESTVNTYRYMFREFLKYLYPRPLHQVTLDDITRYHHDLVVKKNVSRSYQNQSINAINPVGLKILVSKNSINMYYVYVLQSNKDNLWYTGYCQDLEKRIKEHERGSVKSTRNRRPFRLIYFEGCLCQQDATRREKYLKSGNGKIYLKSRLRVYFNPTG